MVLEGHEDLLELGSCLLQPVDMLKLCDGAGVANASDNVLALGIDQVITVEFLLAVCGVARKCNTGSGSLALVAEDHALDVDRGAQIVSNLILLAIQSGARIVPAAENGLDRKTKLRVGILGEAHLAVGDKRGILLGGNVLGEDCLELLDELLHILGGQISVAFHAANDFFRIDSIFEQVAVEAHDHVGEHLDETTIAIPGKTRIIGMFDQAVDGLVVQTKVEYGVHHARHRHGSTGAHGNEQGIFCITDFLADTTLEVETILLDLVESAFGPGVVGVGVFHTGLTGDGESRRHRKADYGHLGKVSALAAEDIFHILVALGNVVAFGVLTKRVDTLDVSSHCILLR